MAQDIFFSQGKLSLDNNSALKKSHDVQPVRQEESKNKSGETTK